MYGSHRSHEWHRREPVPLLQYDYVRSLSPRFSAMRILGHRNMTVGSEPGFFQLKRMVSANCLARTIRRFL